MRLSRRIISNKAIGIAHDALGFGFTDRPNADTDGGLYQYGFENNVGIGLALMNDSLARLNNDDYDASLSTNINNEVKKKSIAIFGHSMGSKSASLMALYYATHQKQDIAAPNLVVLVAPALEGVTLPSRRGYGLKSVSKRNERGNSWIRKLAKRVWIAWRKIFVDYPFRYGLRRLVCATKDFWRKGLALAWGDPNCLSDSDVLRFQWPSIGKGWEQGLINFTRACILSSSSSQHILDDGQLLNKVANLEGTQVVIMYGSNDKVVRIDGAIAEQMRKDFPNIKLVRMEGQGHDPFEEKVDEFISALEDAIIE